MKKEGGELIMFEDIKKKRLGRIEPLSEKSLPNNHELYRRAKVILKSGNRDYSNRLKAYLQACSAVTFDSRERIGSGLRRAATLVMPNPKAPIDINGLLFEDETDLEAHIGSEDEVRALLGDERAQEFIAMIEQQQMELIGFHEEMLRFFESIQPDLKIISNARRNGVSAREILGPDDIRRLLATKNIFDGMVGFIPGTRGQISSILASLRDQSADGIKLRPLYSAIKGVGTLCSEMNLKLDEICRTARLIAGSSPSHSNRETCAEIKAMTEKARAIFAPFTTDNYVISTSQISDLQALLRHLQRAFNPAQKGLFKGIHQIEHLDAIGKHVDAGKFEDSLGLERVLEDFKRNVGHFRKIISVHYPIVAVAGFESGVALKSIPPSAVQEAKDAAGIVESDEEREKNLVLPAHRDLRLG